MNFFIIFFFVLFLNNTTKKFSIMKNYYEILGIEENSSQDEIKKAYRGLAIKHHPDKGGDESMFKEINEAYENIGDPQKRSQYDNNRKNPFSGGGRGGASFEDLFANMFGGANPFEQRKPQAPQKIVKLKITPIESYLGVEKNIFYVREIGCQGCGGSGGEQQMCSGCNGEGFKVKTFGTGFMVQHVRATCDVCGGRRYTLVHKCYFCSGKGTKSESTELKIKIPVGIDSGQFLQMEGYGDFVNGMVGNLLLQVEVEPANGFEKIKLVPTLDDGTKMDFRYLNVDNERKFKNGCGDKFDPSLVNINSHIIKADADGFIRAKFRLEMCSKNLNERQIIINVVTCTNPEQVIATSPKIIVNTKERYEITMRDNELEEEIKKEDEHGNLPIPIPPSRKRKNI
jgi:molecular chaperone DnaJ